MKRAHFALLILLTAISAIKTNAAEPNYPDDPNALLQGKWNAAVLVLQNKDLDYNDKSDKVDRILNPVFHSSTVNACAGRSVSSSHQ